MEGSLTLCHDGAEAKIGQEVAFAALVRLAVEVEEHVGLFRTCARAIVNAALRLGHLWVAGLLLDSHVGLGLQARARQRWGSFQPQVRTRGPTRTRGTDIETGNCRRCDGPTSGRGAQCALASCWGLQACLRWAVEGESWRVQALCSGWPYELGQCSFLW